MKLVWTENFDGPAIDETKWNVHNRNTGSVSIKEGKLYLAMLPGKESTYWQSTGISTANKFSQAQGYFEASMRMLQTAGRSGRFEVRNKSLDEPPSARIFFESWGDDHISPTTQVADFTGIRMLRPVKHDINLDGERPIGSSIPMVSIGRPSTLLGMSTGSRSIARISKPRRPRRCS